MSSAKYIAAPMTADLLDSVLERQVSAVCPIFVRESSGVVDALGSGVFITLADRKFLLTAAHVTDRASSGDLLVPGPERLIHLQGFHASGRLPRSKCRNDDIFDIAYFQLQESFAAQLNPFFRFLDIADINLFDATKAGDVYSMIGFPGSEPSRAGEALARERFDFIGDARDSKFYRKHGYSIDHHILLHYPRTKIKRLGTPNLFRPRYRDSAPDPEGMSGCAVVALYGPNPEVGDRQPVARLAGILTTYYPSEHTFAATRINCFIHCILKNYPDIPVTHVGSFTHNRT